MNKKLFKDHIYIINNIITLNQNLNQDEMNYRKYIINREYNDMLIKNTPTTRFYQLSHEIRCISFLTNYGTLHIASDQNDEAGCDFELNGNIQIEAVCCSRGDENKNGLSRIPEFSLINYNPKEKIILSRITNSICEKLKFYNERVGNSIDSKKPYVIFLGLGNLTFGMVNYDYGFELNKILCGVSYSYLTYDRNKDAFSNLRYSYNKSIYVDKYDENGTVRTVEIPATFFENPRYNFVSAIIYSSANLEEDYNVSNTFIFINPCAKNKIRIADFKNVYYWKMDKDGNYVLRKNGKKYNHNKNKKIF